MKIIDKENQFHEMHREFKTITKFELLLLADKLLAPEVWVIDRCIAFILAETRGRGHGRVRALMCRRLKRCTLGRTHETDLVICILERLSTGNFSEQFKDQIRLALQLNRFKVMSVCQNCLVSVKPHVRRYAEWTLAIAHEQTN